MTDSEVVDGQTAISNSNHPTHKTSKKGYVRVSRDVAVDCPNCDEIHKGTDDGVRRDIPGGHKRWVHYRCPNEGGFFAAEKGSNRSVSE
jgi:predicted RNA-binding Zn-ribbon protein involved in translation (DUF1610 family)